MKKYSTVLWDVDGTLLDFSYSQRYAITRCFQSIGREITEEMVKRYNEINDFCWKQLELGKITKDRLLVERFITLFAEYDIRDVDVESFRKEYQKRLGSVYRFLDDSLTVCKSLRGRVKQYVVTNGVSSTQRNKLKLSGLADVMDGLFISEEVGAPKPYREFFDYCLEHLEEKDRERILMVGDSLSSDIKGAVLAGIPSCWYRPAGTVNSTEYRPDYEIDDLHGIYGILDGAAPLRQTSE